MKYIYLTFSLLACLAYTEDEEEKKTLLRKKQKPECLADYSSSANKILDELEKKTKTTPEPTIKELAQSVKALQQQISKEKTKSKKNKKKKSTGKDNPTPLVSCDSCFSCKMICTIS